MEGTLLSQLTARQANAHSGYSVFKDLIEQHPMRAITSSYLIWSKKTKGKLGVRPLARIYSDLKAYFSKICDKAIGQDDRLAILHLLKKPWNPYLILSRYTVIKVKLPFRTVTHVYALARYSTKHTGVMPGK